MTSTSRVQHKLDSYKRVILLTDGLSTPFLAKTAISMLRYRTDDVAAVFDRSEAGKTAEDLFQTGGSIPVIAAFEDYPQDEPADAMFIGIAPPGGHLPSSWRPVVLEALSRGIDVVSGLHDFLSDDPEFSRAAKENACQIIDVRRNNERDTAQGFQFGKGSTRVLTVGHDCSVGKMVAALEVQLELTRRGHDACFAATGQTGIMISGDGIPVDCVVADFVNGAVEKLVRRFDDRDFILIEGQGSISHPSYSAVTLGLLHGCAPDGLIFCYEVGRTMVKGLEGVPLRSNRELIDAYEMNASLRHPCKVIGIAMNSRRVSPEAAQQERERLESEFRLPVCDVYRDGAGVLANAVEQLAKEKAG